MKLLNNKFQMIALICAIINIVIIYILYFFYSGLLKLSLVVLSFLLFLLMDLTSKNEKVKFARGLASRYTLTALFATLISFSIISIINHEIVLESTAVIYINIIFLFVYHIMYYSILNKADEFNRVQITRYKYIYWVLSLLILAFIILSLIQ